MKAQERMERFRNDPSENVIDIAQRISMSGEGSLLSGNKVTDADIRIARDVLSQCSIAVDASGKKIQRPCACKIRSLGDLWIKWSKTHHTFESVALSKEKAHKFGSGTREMMVFDKKEELYYITLKWRAPAKAQKGDTAKIAARRQLSPDEKKQNAVSDTIPVIDSH